MSLHEGHRKRLRERFRREGLEHFAPHEILELLLFYSRARGDVNQPAHELINVFGSLKGVLEARPEQLMMIDGVGEEAATLLTLIVPLFRRYYACICEEVPLLKDQTSISQYCRAMMMGLRSERFYVISLSATGRVLGHRMISEGCLDEVVAYPRAVVETAMNHNAMGVVLCHNHPDGVPLPSDADIHVTNRLRDILERLSIHLVDHIIVAGDVTYSCVYNRVVH